ncbi:MAG: hypothetical protein B7Y86_04195 [Brevundimonas subvibrioides]|uniref:IPTL-CTERM protein sorting domain-containing protein n=1 Tax=Brevundimonas subvibrioides TaxID=74313 RepID=A0A258HNN9_9CAUL|nr:IPTL-CTERM sorting domain-containing protein [Brevundimonas subvibrioides]OYX58207.1 MAG: hypothetical protein B7Y86_04195 [Brevundimonas subvibrioides]
MKKLASALVLGGMLAAGALIAPGLAHAAPVTWTVPATTLPDGAVVSGTFVYDTATSTISNVNITQTAVRPGAYTFLANFPGFYRGGQRAASVIAGNETWYVNTSGILAAGGAYSAARIGTGGCLSAPGGICNNADITNSVTNVTITGVGASAVPTMSEWAMILFGLMLAGGAALYVQRRQMAV